MSEREPNGVTLLHTRRMYVCMIHTSAPPIIKRTTHFISLSLSLSLNLSPSSSLTRSNFSFEELHSHTFTHSPPNESVKEMERERPRVTHTHARSIRTRLQHTHDCKTHTWIRNYKHLLTASRLPYRQTRRRANKPRHSSKHRAHREDSRLPFSNL